MRDFLLWFCIPFVGFLGLAALVSWIAYRIADRRHRQETLRQFDLEVARIKAKYPDVWKATTDQ